MMPWGYESWDLALRLDPERAVGSGACWGLLDSLLSFWCLFGKQR